MHILQIYKDYFPVLGGIENHLRVLAEGLAQRGHRVTVLVTNTGPGDEIFRHDNLTVIKAGRALHLASTPLSPRMLIHARRMHDVDLMQLHFPFPPGDLAALLVPNRPPLVVYYHSDIVRQQNLLRVYGPLLRHTLKRASRIITSSPAYIHSSPTLAPHAAKCTVVPLSVDPARFAHFDPAAVARLRERYGERLVLFVGKLRYYKGLHVLLDAWPQLRQPAQLLLVGTGPEEGRLRQQVARLGLTGQVHFLGEVPDAELPNVYAAAQVFAFPSHLRAEAFGIAQLEAQAAGLPIVCTELGTGTSYITLHGETGLVVPPNNPAALANALSLLLANPTLARQLGAAGRARAAQEFSHWRMIERMAEVYRASVRDRA
ncbi:MAG: glycosyltransferase [Chloroflexaceae bacterium]|jgi:rhamnosyl/mannosyltransferase|nr:glycosyltransferase [Chloroflexaceae bacterium]